MMLLHDHEKWPARQHQLSGVDQLIHDIDVSRGRTIPKVFALFDEVGAGKTKQCVDAAQILWSQFHCIDTVLVFTPGFARSTWAHQDPTLGEVAKHAWDSVPNVVHEYHGNYTELDFNSVALHWVVSNYEFIRRAERRDDLIRQLRGRRVWLILDESWAIKGHSLQMKACAMIRRKRADRCTILNGTPLADGKPMDLYYQFAVLDPGIIGAQNRTQFRSQYCMMGGFAGKQIVGYQHLDELNRRIAPYVLSRRTRDCFDLPPMLPPLTIEAKLSDATWKVYREMRDNAVAELAGQTSLARQAIVKALRLAQVTSGYLGGLETDMPTVGPSEPMPQWLRSLHEQEPPTCQAPTSVVETRVTKEISREKLDALLFWLSTLGVQPDKLLVWCRWRPELERTTIALRHIYPEVFNLKGGQSVEDRETTKRALAPGAGGRAAIVGNTKAGGASLNFSAANIAVFLSNGPALIERTQSIGRIERPGATQPMLIVDVVATGPKGQKTIDHAILKSLRSKEDMAKFTVSEWRRILAEE